MSGETVKQPMLIALEIEVPSITNERRQVGRPRIEGRGNEKNPYRWKRAEHYREQGRQRSSSRYSRRRVWMRDMKSLLGCQMCGERTPAALDFHHIDESTKTGQPAQLLTGACERFLAEISKCALLCSTCHRKVHHHERAVDLTPIDVAALPPMPR